MQSTAYTGGEVFTCDKGKATLRYASKAAKLLAHSFIVALGFSSAEAKSSDLLDLSPKKDELCHSEGGRVSFYFENDIFAGTDRDYTNGGRLAWISGKRQSLSDVAPLQRHLKKIAGGEASYEFFKEFWGFESTKTVQYQYGVALTQLMYTPDSLAAVPPPGQRPYAGWLGLGFSLHLSDERAINSVEFTIGTVGPHAYAEPVQDFVHDVRGIEKFNGWDNQIPNELTVNLNLNQKRRYTYFEPEDLNDLPLSLNAFTDLGVSLGNFRTAIDLGWHLQFGYNVPVDFSDPRLTATSNSISWDVESDPCNLSVYLILGVRCSAVFHDISMDGPVFRDFDTGIDRRIFVGEFYTGFGVRYKNVEFSYIQTIRSKEYDQQEDQQEYGSLAVRIRY